MTTYTALCKREGAWWVIHIPELGNRATQARRLEQVPGMVRSLVSLIEDIPAEQIQVDVRAEQPKVVKDALAARRALREAEKSAERSTTSAVMAMLDSGYTVRDVGKMLGLSPQRISQIAPSAGRRRKRGSVVKDDLAKRRAATMRGASRPRQTPTTTREVTIRSKAREAGSQRKISQKAASSRKISQGAASAQKRPNAKGSSSNTIDALT